MISVTLSVLALGVRPEARRRQTAATSVTAQDRIDAPRRVTYVSPQYTAEAMKAKIQGDVVVNAKITVIGTLEDLRVERSLDKVFGLDEKALEAVRQWRYEPARRNGEPFEVRVNVTVKFELGAAELAAPVWPDAFIETTTGNDGWQFGTIAVGSGALQYGTPNGWTADARPPAPRVLRLSSADGRFLVEVGPPVPFLETGSEASITLPQSSDMRLREMANTIANRGRARAPVQFSGVGQVQIGPRWWLWFGMDAAPPSVAELRDEFRSALTQSNVAGTHAWVFSTIEGQQVYQVLCVALLPPAGTERAADLKRAGAVFASVLRRMTLSAR